MSTPFTSLPLSLTYACYLYNSSYSFCLHHSPTYSVSFLSHSPLTIFCPSPLPRLHYPLPLHNYLYNPALYLPTYLVFSTPLLTVSLSTLLSLPLVHVPCPVSTIPYFCTAICITFLTYTNRSIPSFRLFHSHTYSVSFRSPFTISCPPSAPSLLASFLSKTSLPLLSISPSPLSPPSTLAPHLHRRTPNTPRSPACPSCMMACCRSFHLHHTRRTCPPPSSSPGRDRSPPSVAAKRKRLKGCRRVKRV